MEYQKKHRTIMSINLRRADNNKKIKLISLDS